MFTTAFAKFFDARKWPLFLLGAVAVTVLGNATHDFLKRTFGEDPRGLITIIGLAAAVLFGAAWALAAWLERPAAIIPPTRTRPVARRGLILLVGLRDEVCREAIRHHRSALARVWLLCSPQSSEVAARLAGDHEVLAGVPVETIVVTDVYDPRGSFDAVLAVRERLPEGWASSDLIADFTGLTATASVGLVLACLQTGIAIEYTPAEYSADGRALRPLPPQEVVLNAPVPSPLAPSGGGG